MSIKKLFRKVNENFGKLSTSDFSLYYSLLLEIVQNKKAIVKKYFFFLMLFCLLAFLFTGLRPIYGTGGSNADGAACSYDAECINLCDNQTAIGLGTDSLVCFSAGSCHGGSSFCNDSMFRCEFEAGSATTCDDYMDNSCLVDSSGFCDGNCAAKTLTAPTAFDIKVNYSYKLDTALGGLNLTWSDASDSESRFQILRSTDNITFSEVANVTNNTLSYADNNLNDNTFYFYLIRPISNGSQPNCTGLNSSGNYNLTADRTAPFKPIFNVTNYSTYVDMNWSEGDTDLLVYYPLEDGAGTTAKDFSKNKNTGRFVNVTWNTTGLFEKALNVNRTTNAYLNTTTDLDFVNSSTGMLWVRFNEVVSNQVIMGQKATPEFQVQMQGTTNSQMFRVNITNSAGVSSIVDSTDGALSNQWYHIAFTYNGTHLKLYINGLLVGTNSSISGDLVDTGNVTTFGGRADSALSVNGTIDEIRVYNRSLSQREIINDMQSGLIKKGIFRSTTETGTYTQQGGQNFSDTNYTDGTATDSNIPNEATSLASTSHATTLWSNDSSVDFSWTTATDNATIYWYNITAYDNSTNFNSTIKNATVRSGLDGYDAGCNQTSNDLDTSSKDYEESQTTHTCTFPDGNSNYVHLKSRDNAGNWGATSVDSGPYYIDTVGLSACSVARIEEYSIYANISGSTVYYNSLGSGNFTVNVTATDALSGIANISYPATTSNGTNDTSSPYSYNYNFTTSSVYSSSVTITCYDNAHNRNTTTFTITLDTTDPTGGFIGYANEFSSNTQITFYNGTDAGAGLNSSNSRLLIRSASLSDDNTCGSFGSWSQEGSLNPVSPYSDTLTAATCYQYMYEVYDLVYNGVNYTNASTLIYNNVPTQNTPSIIPSALNITSNLTCNWSSVADIDSHKVINITNWYKNNRSIMLLYMPFEGGSVSGVPGTNGSAVDYSGYAKNGSVVNATFNRTAGRVGGAYDFNSSKYITINDGSFYSTSVFTVEAWVYKRGLNSTNKTIIDNRDGAGDGWALYIPGSNKARFDYNGYAVNSTSTINANGWYHIVATADSGGIDIYINGTLENTVVASGTISESTNAVIGARSFTSRVDNFNGTIDEIKIYNRSLSSDQIYQNYLAGAAGRTPKVIIFNETSYNDTWLCSVTPNDGYQDGTTSNSSTASIGQADYSPVIISFSLIPLLANTTADLSCNATAVDDFNTTLSVEYWWYNNTVLWQSGNKTVTNNTNTVISIMANTNTTRFEVWNCTIRPFDGSSRNGFNSTFINISNALPIQSAPSITPSPANATSNLTCNWNSVSDSDSDVVVNITNWYKNNRSIMLLYMPFEGGSVSGVLGTNGSSEDYSGYAKNGSVVNATFNRTAGKVGGAYDFNSSKFIAIDDDSFYSTSIITVEAWIYKRALNSTNKTIIDNRDGAGDGWALYIPGSNKIRFDYNGYAVNSTSTINPNQWYHVVATSDSSTIKIYINGTMESSVAITGTISEATDAVIGARSFTSRIDNFNGTIDEIKIYNRSLSRDQIYQNYLAGNASRATNIIIFNETSYNDTWLCSVTPNDGYEDGSVLNSSAVNIGYANFAPSATAISLSPAIVNTSSNIQCAATVVDDFNATLNVEYWWYNNSVFTLGGNTTGVTNNTNTVITTLGDGNTTRWEVWNCTIRVNDGSLFAGFNSTKINISNAPPYRASLLLPTSGNTTYHNRTVYFNWSSSDLEGDVINYTINITFSSTVACGPDILINLTNNQYISTYDYCVDSPIYWEIMAFDRYNSSEWSEIWNFTIESFIGLNLTTSSIDFGTLNMLESRDTETGYSPLVIENTGNVMLNISKISANASPFSNVGLNTIYFRYKADNTTETPSYNYSGSTTSWANITDIALLNSTVIKQLDYNDTHDSAQVDINITIPFDEPWGQKSVTLYVIGEAT